MPAGRTVFAHRSARRVSIEETYHMSSVAEVR